MPILIAWIIEHWLIAVVVGALAVGGTAAVVTHRSGEARSKLSEELIKDVGAADDTNATTGATSTASKSAKKSAGSTGSSSTSSSNQTPWNQGPSDQGSGTGNTGTSTGDQQAPWNQGPSQ